MSIYKINITVWDARYSDCQIKLNKRDVELFKEKFGVIEDPRNDNSNWRLRPTYLDTTVLGRVGNYKKKPYREYYLNNSQLKIVKEHPDCFVFNADEDWFRDNN